MAKPCMQIDFFCYFCTEIFVLKMIRKAIEESIAVKKHILEDSILLEKIALVSEKCVNSLRAGSRVWFCGNGGSAADAQHLAAELSGRFYVDRKPLPAEALNVNSSFITAVANDYGFDQVYARMLSACGRKGDVLFAISTSGNSANVLNAIGVAKLNGITTIGFTGATGGRMADLCDILVNVPSTTVPRIQEAHIMIGHIICELIEKTMFV